MSIRTEIRVNNPFQRLARGINAETDIATDEAAAQVGNEYRLAGRVDTGAQVASAYVVKTNGDSTYSEAVGNAQSFRPGFVALPEITPDAEHQAVVGVAASYASLNENGTDKRSGDGAFVEAVETVRPRYIEDLKKAIGRNHAK